WIDWDHSGTFDAFEQVVHSTTLFPGQNFEAFGVPLTAVVGTTYARFRLSTAGGLGPTGPAADGEVEDYVVQIIPPDFGTDFGDAPDSYHTLRASDGARHGVVAGFHLGGAIDGEDDGQP